MRKIISAFIVIYTLASCTGKVYYSSTWQSKPVTVDGLLPEWSNPLRFYDQETGISYSISNDKVNLYLVCSIANEFMQLKILRSGLEFGIDTLGKKSYPVVIKYPIPNISEREVKTNHEMQPKSDSNIKPDRSSFKLKLLSEARELQLIGFKPSIGKIISLSPPSNTGISAAINFDVRGIMNYEAVIPFSTFYKNKLTPADSNKIINYEIKINPIANSNSGSNNGGGSRGGGSHGAGMHGGGMGGGGMHGGGMGGGGMHGGGMNSRNRSGENSGSDYQKNAGLSGVTKTTIKLKLAYK